MSQNPTTSPSNRPRTAALDTPLQFRLFGQLEMWRDGRRVALEPIKQRLILARLLLRAGRPVATEELLDSIWGQDRPPTARAIVHNQIRGLRQVLEPDPAKPRLLLTHRPGYLLHTNPQQVDLHRFRRLAEEGRQALAAGDVAAAASLLRTALSLWRGPLLADVAPTLKGRWPELARADALRARAREACVEADLRLGRSAGVIDELECLLRRDPLRPRLHGLLMLALCRSNRKAEALTIYQQASRALGEEFGTPPGTALMQLADRYVSASR